MSAARNLPDCRGLPGELVERAVDRFDGYGVLIFDRSGEGQSQGDYNQLGWDLEPDGRAAITTSCTGPTSTRRGSETSAWSVGGETFIQAAAHDRQLSAIVAERSRRTLRPRARSPPRASSDGNSSRRSGHRGSPAGPPS